jgi:hypothetical protein
MPLLLMPKMIESVQQAVQHSKATQRPQPYLPIGTTLCIISLTSLSAAPPDSVVTQSVSHSAPTHIYITV